MNNYKLRWVILVNWKSGLNCDLGDLGGWGGDFCGDGNWGWGGAGDWEALGNCDLGGVSGLALCDLARGWEFGVGNCDLGEFGVGRGRVSGLALSELIGGWAVICAGTGVWGGEGAGVWTGIV